MFDDISNGHPVRFVDDQNMIQQVHDLRGELGLRCQTACLTVIQNAVRQPEQQSNKAPKSMWFNTSAISAESLVCGVRQPDRQSDGSEKNRKTVGYLPEGMNSSPSPRCQPVEGLPSSVRQPHRQQSDGNRSEALL